MPRKLFCEISPLTYKISVIKQVITRKIYWLIHHRDYAESFSKDLLPINIYTHASLIRRSLGNVNPVLQDNKAQNLSIAAPKISGILIKPGETFSFWRVVGKCTKRKGYKEGLTISLGKVDQGIGGGMCQFTNLIHWMILHSPLTITEHHHHNQIDLFPDYGRQVPFGTGTSIMYNYLDYQFVNNTEQTFQLIVYTGDQYLHGQLQSDQEIKYAYHIVEENQWFSKEADGYYRNNEVYRETIDKCTGNRVQRELVVKNHAKVMYDAQFIPRDKILEVN